MDAELTLMKNIRNATSLVYRAKCVRNLIGKSFSYVDADEICESQGDELDCVVKSVDKIAAKRICMEDAANQTYEYCIESLVENDNFTLDKAETECFSLYGLVSLLEILFDLYSCLVGLLAAIVAVLIMIAIIFLAAVTFLGLIMIIFGLYCCFRKCESIDSIA